MNPDSGHEEIKKLLVENQRLLLENNQMLHKMRKNAIIGTILRMAWFLLVLGVPVYLYFSYIKPNMDNLLDQYGALQEMTKGSSALTDWYQSMTEKKPQ